MKPLNSRQAIEKANAIGKNWENTKCDETGYPIVLKNYEETLEYIRINKHAVHHSATGRGYLSCRIAAVVLPYKGNWGTGEILIEHFTNRYVIITYLT